jgi:hypothetical protein
MATVGTAWKPKYYTCQIFTKEGLHAYTFRVPTEMPSGQAAKSIPSKVRNLRSSSSLLTMKPSTSVNFQYGSSSGSPNMRKYYSFLEKLQFWSTCGKPKDGPTFSTNK